MRLQQCKEYIIKLKSNLKNKIVKNLLLVSLNITKLVLCICIEHTNSILKKFIFFPKSLL